MPKLKRLIAVPTNGSLKKWNIWLAGLHAVQAVAILLLSTGKSFPVSASFLTTDSLQSTSSGHLVLAPATHHLVDINLGYLVTAFFVLAALAHISMATWYRRRYEDDLATGMNRLRWFEYALSASTMLIGIALLAGMYDVVSLGFVFLLCAVMNLLGLVMETHNPASRRGDVRWVSFVVGCIAGITPWLGIGAYLVFTNVFGGGHVPAFVYGIYGSILVLFGCFAANMYLQYKQIGPWKNYLFGERGYMILSLVAKSLLAWQIFAGALHP